MDLDATGAIQLSHRLRSRPSYASEPLLSYKTPPSPYLVPHPVGAIDDRAGVSRNLSLDHVIAVNRGIAATEPWSKDEVRSCRSFVVRRWMLSPMAECDGLAETASKRSVSSPHSARSSAQGSGHNGSGRPIGHVKFNGANHLRCPERDSSAWRSGFLRVRLQHLEKRRSDSLPFRSATLNAVKIEANGDASDVPTPRVSVQLGRHAAPILCWKKKAVNASRPIACTKINRELLFESINAVIEGSARRNRKFTETVELQIALENLNPHKEKPEYGAFRVKYCTKPNFKVCVIGDQKHCDEAKAQGLDFISMDTVRMIRKKSSITKHAAPILCWKKGPSMQVGQLPGCRLSEDADSGLRTMPTEGRTSRLEQRRAFPDHGVARTVTRLSLQINSRLTRGLWHLLVCFCLS
ncbi:hypothetical protein HPB50_016431 [Hyalomma asiaticum]|uniref:Uncharacterized protein n=1 Tax=Hyalomma asiaticum TaxID=266040 RepID=A0ACB7TKZ0_HYAAI|nr:hypothetical protein HPB50_016431 [Hyalomma asiaticum]